MRRSPLLSPPGLLAIASFLLATAASIWLATWSCTYSGTSSQGAASSTDLQNVTQTQTQSCSSLINQNGKWVLFLLAVPVVLTVVGLFGAWRNSRRLVLGPAILLIALCVVGLLTIGRFFLPAALALIVSGGLIDRDASQAQSSQPAATG